MFSTDGLVLQLGYALLIAALLARTPQRMRLLIAASAFVGLLRATLIVRDYATIGWMILLLGVWPNTVLNFATQTAVQLRQTALPFGPR